MTEFTVKKPRHKKPMAILFRINTVDSCAQTTIKRSTQLRYVKISTFLSKSKNIFTQIKTEL